MISLDFIYSFRADRFQSDELQGCFFFFQKCAVIASVSHLLGALYTHFNQPGSPHKPHCISCSLPTPLKHENSFRQTSFVLVLAARTHHFPGSG